MAASMEPGHEDREYQPPTPPMQPQWSPVMKTGNTGSGGGREGAVARGLNGARS